MCGIFTIVSSPVAVALGRQPADLPEVEASPESLKESLSSLDFARFHQAYTDARARQRWRDVVNHLQGKLVRSKDSDASAARAEKRLLSDVAWRIEHDLMSLMQSTSELLGDSDFEESGPPVWVGWQIELTLRALGRIEVRGRDSAGIAVMLWFEDEAARDELLATAEEGAHGQILHQPVAGTSCLVLVYRVAEEVGALGYNESTLRALISKDELFERAIRAQPRHCMVTAHTRWASNGIISLENAHPVDGVLVDDLGGALIQPWRSLAVLNGDVDNYIEITDALESGWQLPAGVTTDAKAIPMLVELGDRDNPGERVDEVLVEMMDKRLEGSFATVLTRADRPGTMWCAQMGTGQALYLARAQDVVVATSEVYGSAEMTENYWNVEEARPDEVSPLVLRVDMKEDGVEMHRLSGSLPGPYELGGKRAEITTRDVDRRGFTHYFRKELEESIDSVKKTIVGRYERSSAREEDPRIDFTNLYSHARDDVFEAIAAKAFQRFVFVGQGSAHVAGKVGVRFLAEALAEQGVVCEAMTAGDFSAHELRTDLSDTCLIAVSQSGTTTDTNRCLTLGRQRGARVLGIVNRRNSAMVELSDAVVYTSDGRDIEMAVASTKAFYSQVVASFMLAQHIGLLVGSLVETQVSAALAELERLPAVMRAAFDIEDGLAECARAVGLQRRHWSLLGTGPSVATAEEIRIKFSELCYKSVSVDILENKKHIDLSAEPLILAALHDLRSDLVSDAVKEVSIFSAHRAITVVLCDRDAELYKGHTPYVFQVPPIGYGLSAVTTAILGHLFAYHTAVVMDEVAQRLRHLRKLLLKTTVDDAMLSGTQPMGFEGSNEALVFLADLFQGRFDALWPGGTSSRLSAVLQMLGADLGTSARLGALMLDADPEADPAGDEDEWCLAHLSTAIADSTRPIDSIRHQAKTITVGTSRSGYSQESVLGRALGELGLGLEDLPRSLQPSLVAVDHVLKDVPSGIRYEVEGSGPFLSLKTKKKMGSAGETESRFDVGAPLNGTKLTCVRRRQPLVVRGVRDGANLLVFPILQGGVPREVVLLHLVIRHDVSTDEKLRFLEAFPQRTEAILEHFEEIAGRPVALSELTRYSAEQLFFAAPTTLPREVLENDPEATEAGPSPRA